MNILIFLDDERTIEDVTWVQYTNCEQQFVARTVKDVTTLIRETLNENPTSFVLVSLDHDLQDFDEDGNESTGMTAINNIINMVLEDATLLPRIQIIVHSQNPIGKRNMRQTWENFVRFLGSSTL